MMPNEKTKLLALLEHKGKWCRNAEAVDALGTSVHYDDNHAVAWDITGALCRLFGWRRACQLFGQIQRHIFGKQTTLDWPPRDGDLDAMKALQEFNDHRNTTFDSLRQRIESMPVWNVGSRALRSTRAT